MKMSGAKMVIESLHQEGVEVVFGYPGGAIMNVYDEIYKQNYFEHILNRHEQACVIAAEGYARSTGKTGVAIVTSGPGFTNAITGIADAYMDSIPIVIISGQVPTTIIGTDGFQEIDAVGISRPCTKHNYLVNKIEDLPRIIKEAFHLASTGRPGPVHVDIPKDITAQIGEFIYPSEVNMPTYKPTLNYNKKQLKRAMEAISNAKKPLLYIGGGAILSNCGYEIRDLAKKLNIPAVETLMARGVMGDENPLFFGMLGMHGEYAANMAAHETDLLISLGARFDDRVTGRLDEFASKAKVIHIDIDPTSIAKLVVADYPIVGDLKLTVQAMIEDAENYEINDFSNWVELLKDYREKEPLRYIDTDDLIKPQWPIQRVGKILGDNAIISTDVGQHQMWTAQFFPFSYPRQWITSGGLGTMGFGLPAALGAARAFKGTNRVVVNFTGDGSILMNIQELMTCSEYELPVINIVLNNNYLGMVRQWQTMFYENRLAETDLTAQPKFKMLAEAFNCLGYTVSTKKEFDEAFKDAVEKRKPAMIEVIVARNEEVLPMVPNGHSLNEMTLLKGDR
ncbi:acetolactate synthase large subunit [Aliarcobacter cryaerophilus]|jgi:acetolactate synthase-1/2/3 large subunit|uniref:Acetolactate synthase n=2 Tax=unclassified Arcobacter TaxID=2593671 RepID=A0AA96D9B0_9BACT|nr:acetolactate synthase large subunit [Aliarcobacter cryaerophilus]NCB10266.1 acetolactate synthase large subunit [Erysipelotrichia bacterium]WNL13460.1 acetolactate synthase large subunit [Arcobacter sp. AZ-2023]WPD09947.1 acetolactate synthase large subunit [Arcobacter sp. DSM 115954]MCT7467292.1 acetolactate synthase large subunit [Aliarcobacter cryaerophilus]MCT7470208.1 acetolactate synthase large subunit [Aliarcobacter cryaerophilus]